MYPRLKMEETPYSKVTTEASVPEFQLTVITVCWNALADLKPTVESVLRQKAKESLSIEHVVVDGASTDGTPEWLAEQLAAGRIERYVSEPDRGIYDAMNKGINLARGEVLAFLNAGDWYLDVDLAPCVLPICRGAAESVAACTDFVPKPGQIKYGKPQYRQLYFRTPCCHQAYFASQAAYCRLGGYDAQRFTCYADADFMYRHYRERGEPLLITEAVVHFSPGGLSNSSGDLFTPEQVELWWRNRDMIAKRCVAERCYRRAFESTLAYTAINLHDWQERHGRMIQESLGKLQELCLNFSERAHSMFAKAGLKFFGRFYLPHLASRSHASGLMNRLARFFSRSCFVPMDNPYRCELYAPIEPIWRHPLVHQIISIIRK